jgi:hypothetical protein
MSKFSTDDYTLYGSRRLNKNKYYLITGNNKENIKENKNWACDYCNYNLDDRCYMFQISGKKLNGIIRFCNECIESNTFKYDFDKYYEKILYNINEYYFVKKNI